ncbi:VPS9 domain [Trinorchestia longiramus]|nr:VPS9 domain [Trinorchestia longiramus]
MLLLDCNWFNCFKSMSTDREIENHESSEQEGGRRGGNENGRGGAEGGVQEELVWQPHEYLLEEGSTPDAVVRPHIDQSSLLCRTGCGFYGYPAWQGHCSKCYKELQSRSSSRRSVRISRPVFDPANIKNKVSRSVSDVSVLPGKASNLINRKIDKLDEKRRQQFYKHKNNNIVKSIFRKSTSSKSRDKDRAGGTDSATSSSQELDAFLKTLSKEGGGAIRKQVSVCVDKVRRSLQSQHLEHTEDLLQELYTSLHSMVSTHHAFAGMSEDDVSRVVTLTERYVCTRLHTLLRGAVNAQCEEQDLATQDRIRRLNWISADMLESQLDDEDEKLAPAVDTIIGSLLELDGAVVPSDKLAVLVNVSYQIMQALSSLSGAPAAADDFLPALIFCLIRANPPMLHSNIAYITNFAPHSQLHSGETGYYFTNLCCAVAFIEKVCGASLGLTEEEFSRHMKGCGLSRHPKPPPSVTALTNTLHRFSRAADSLTAVNESYARMIAQIDELKDVVTDKVTEVLRDNPCVLRQPYTTEGILLMLDSKQTHLLPQLSQDDTLSVPQAPSSDEVSAKTCAKLPEIEEAFNLYYSLDNLIPQELEKSSRVPAAPAEHDSSPSTPRPPDKESALLVRSAASLLDEPVPDNTLSLFDQSPISLQESSSISLLDHGSAPMPDHGPASMLDLSSATILDHGPTSSLDHSCTSLLELDHSSLLGEASSSCLNASSISLSNKTPASLLDEPVLLQGSSSLLPLPEYSGFREQSNLIPNIPCGMGPTSLNDSLRDFGSGAYSNSISYNSKQFSESLKDLESLKFSESFVPNSSVLSTGNEKGIPPTSNASAFKSVSFPCSVADDSSDATKQLFAIWPDENLSSGYEKGSDVLNPCILSNRPSSATDSEEKLNDDDRPVPAATPTVPAATPTVPAVSPVPTASPVLAAAVSTSAHTDLPH